jgi:beta-glucosidase
LARDFPQGFLWGTAASAYQIEGAVRHDGRGESVWDRFSHTPGRIADGSTGDVACDHYHRYPEDIALMQRLGVGAYRFSTAWPRIQPEGRGNANQRGLAFYDRLVDGLLAAGITPWLCLHHWDLPQALEDIGGWRRRDIAYYFADYAALVARRLGDRVRQIAPINEPNVIPWVAYDMGAHAPGACSRRDTLAAIHHLNLAHGLAAQAVRAEDAGLEVGLIISLAPVHPARDDPAHREAAAMLDCLWRRVMADPIMLGRYPEPLAEDLAEQMRPGDLELIAARPAFFGLNHYNRLYAGPDPDRIFGVKDVAPPRGMPVTAMGWQIDPSALLEQLDDLKARYDPLPPVYITENGAAFDDQPDVTGRVEDRARIAFFQGYLGAVLDGIAAGHDIRGYFIWSLLDNFEWSYGYSMRFGIVRVDGQTMARTPKASYDFLRAVIGANRLVEAEPDAPARG